MSKQTSAETIGKIPVRNLWLLLLYASDFYEKLIKDEPDKIRPAEQNPDKIPDLVAMILTTEVEHRLRRMLTHELQRRQADLTRVRGRINHIRTKRRHLLEQGKIACSFDEFTVDVPRNRLVMAALYRLSKILDDGHLKQKCRDYANRFAMCGVSDSFDVRQYTSIQNTRYSYNDARMIAAAQLAWDLRIPTEESGHLDVISLDRSNEQYIRQLFEKAIYGFYKALFVYGGWSVQKGRWFQFQYKAHTSRIDEILPGMQADIIIEKSDGTNRIIIDTKFKEITQPTWHNPEKLRNADMYQMYSYIITQERDYDKMSTTSTGILLYPSVGIDYDESATIQGHKFRFVTVDLNSDIVHIQDRLSALIPEYQFRRRV